VERSAESAGRSVGQAADGLASIALAGITQRAEEYWTQHVQQCDYTIYRIGELSVSGQGPGSSVGIATDYWLDGPGIEYRYGRDFSHTSRPALGPTQPPVQ
jgi:hypothetical protein